MLSLDQVVPYSALYIDMQFQTLFKTLWSYIRPVDQQHYVRMVSIKLDKMEDAWKLTPEEQLLTTLCVRASTDLLLQALDFPPGTEMLMTGVNIPDMVQVLRLHGIVPVPVDVEPQTLGCTVEQFEKARTPRVRNTFIKTKAIMLSYIFGAKFDASEVIAWAKKHNLFIIEDEAESFACPSAKCNPLVDFSTYSFGSIKTCSAFGGSVCIIRNNEILYRKMKAIQDGYPKWPQRLQFKRTLKNIFPMLVLNNKTVNSYFRWGAINLFPNFDYKEFVVASIRGFQKNEQDILSTYRYRIPDPILVMMALRFSTFDVDQFNQATRRQIIGQKILQKGGLVVPGQAIENRNFWLYPVIVPNPQVTYKILNQRGIDAYMGVTQLDIVESPIGSSFQYPKKTLDYFKNILYLPIHQGADLKAIQRICREVVEVVDMMKRQQSRL